MVLSVSHWGIMANIFFLKIRLITIYVYICFLNSTNYNMFFNSTNYDIIELDQLHTYHPFCLVQLTLTLKCRSVLTHIWLRYGKLNECWTTQFTEDKFKIYLRTQIMKTQYICIFEFAKMLNIGFLKEVLCNTASKVFHDFSALRVNVLFTKMVEWFAIIRTVDS